MRPPRHLRLASAALVLLAPAVAACGRSADSQVGTTHTTSAEVLRSEANVGASCPPPNPEAPLASSAGGTAQESSELSAPSEETRIATPAPPAAAQEPAYEEPPLYDPNGGTVSDVGEPYPLPAVPPSFHAPLRPPPASSASNAPQTSFFPESSFGPNYQP